MHCLAEDSEMDQVVEMRNLMKDNTIESRLQRAPSYVQPFLSGTVEDIILVYNQLVTRSETTKRVSMSDSSSECDLSGSPLPYSFSTGDYDDTLIRGPIKHWQKDEEGHGSLSVIKARRILNVCSLGFKGWKVPAWVVCDASDPQQTVLLSICPNIKSGWVTRNTVRLLGHWSYRQAEEYAVNMKKEHLLLARTPGCEVKILMERVYDIQPADYANRTQSSISVRLSWSSSSFTALIPSYADAVVEMLVVLGQATSPAEELWKQLKLVHQLVAVLVVFKGKHATDCIGLPTLECSSANSNRTETDDVISVLQELDYFAMSREGTAHSAEGPQTAKRLIWSVQQAVSSRPTIYLDFINHLFLLLSNCRDSENLAKCLLLVMQEVQSGDAKLFVHPRNPTKLAHTLRELMRGESSLPNIDGIRAMELLVEIGLEKLSKDYTHIFLSSDLATLESLKLPLYNANDPNEAYRKLDVLSRLHVTLEILLLAESEMNFSVSSLQPLAAFCLNNIETWVESLSALLEVGHIKFKAPVSTKEVKNHLKGRYSSSRTQLTSEGSNYKVCTVLHCSIHPIFPFMSPGLSESQLYSDSRIFDADLHCSHLSSLSNKLL